MIKPFETRTIRLYESFFHANAHLFDEGPLLICGTKTIREWAAYDKLASHGVVVVEPWAPNCEFVRHAYPRATVLQTTAESYCASLETWPRTVLWLQGPEHVPKDIGKATLRRYAEHAKLVVAEMPHGTYLQGPAGGNPDEEHRSHWVVRDFAAMGPGWRTFASHDRRTIDAANKIRHLLAVHVSTALASAE